MLPYVNLGFIQIPSYSLMLFLGIIAFFTVSLINLVKLEKKNKQTVWQVALTAAISLIVMYLSASFFDALFHSIEEGRLTFGGITWEGGVIGGVAAFLILSHFIVKKERGKEIELLSLLIPGLVLGHAFGRVGCFLGGCCFGQITESSLGIVFPVGSPAYETYPNTLTHEGSFPVLPTQLFEVAFELVLFLVMTVFRKRLKDKNLAVYLVFYSVFRFILEFWRGDNRGATGIYLSPSQVMSILLFTVGVLIFLFQKKIVFKKLYQKCLFWQENAANGVYNIKKQPLSPEKAEIFEQIAQLYKLKLSGAITQEEYDTKKQQLLDKIE